MYYKDEQGQWVQDHRAIYHRSPKLFEQDTKHPVVFISELFYYFGDKAISIPIDYHELILKGQGCKHNHDPEVVIQFLIWLKANFDAGIHGIPKDNKEAQELSCL